MFEIEYFEEGGEKQVEAFIDSLDAKARAKVFGRLELLEEYGSRIGMPFSRHLEDGIFELRILCGDGNIRILYFFVAGQRIVISHGFLKKTKKAPRREIERAKKNRNRWRATHE